MYRFTQRLAAAAVTGAALILLGATAAWAHVTIAPSRVPTGTHQRITVQVPNEIDGRRTVRVELDFPPGGLLHGTQVPSVPGWSEVTRLTPSGAVSQVEWVALPGGGIGTGQTADLPLVVTTPSAPALLVFKALQTYDDGTVVRWIESPNPDGSPAPRPYPTLLVTGPGGALPTTTVAPPPPPAARAKASRIVETAAVTIAIGGLAAAWLALRRARRPEMGDIDAR